MGCSSSKDAAKEDQPKTMVDEATFMFLSKVALLKRLPPEDLPDLAATGQSVEYKEGDAIITQGDEGDAFFLIKKGTADVQISGNKVATLKSGDYFGENALLRNEPRTATITASAAVVKALKISRASFNALGLAEKLNFGKRGAVGGGADADRKVEMKAPTPKTAEEVALIKKALQANVNLNTITTVDDEKAEAMTAFMWKEQVKAGEAIITQGDMHADFFYVVQSGAFNITKAEKKNEGQSAEAAAAASIGTIQSGGSFGELALLYFAARAATITANEDAVVWVTSRQQFKEVVLKANQKETEQNIKHLGHCEVFTSLKTNEIKELAQAMHEMTFSKDETIFEQGEKGNRLYLLVEGEAAVVKDGTEVSRMAATTEKAHYFGEKALIEDAPRAATIKVISETARSLWVDKESFEMLLGPLGELMKRGKDGTAVVKKPMVAPAAGDSKRFGNYKFANLKKLGLLGCGGFGAVELVEDTKSGGTFALKALSKGYVVKSGMQASVMSEKQVQAMCDSPFVVMLHETFNGDQSLFFLLELALGGELYATYNKKNLWGTEKCAKYYIAGTVFAFDHLHSKKVIYRDLKPENLLLNEKGHVKLTDMGLAKVVIGKTFTTCGTPDYFAPELIKSQGHNLAVDWWMLGILTFELMSGHPPFESATPMAIYSKVQKGINKIAFPKKLKGDCESLIKGLCHATPSERLPMKKGESDNIKNSAWFKDFAWADVENLKMDAPYKPSVKNTKDITNFSANKEDMPPQIPYKDPGNGWDKEFASAS